MLMAFLSIPEIQAQHKLILRSRDTVDQIRELPGGNNLVFPKLNQLIQTHRQNGFLEASIDSLNLGKDTSLAYLSKGKKYQFQSSIIIQSGKTSDTITKKPESFLNMNQLIENELKKLRNNGHPFASAIVDVLNTRDSLISLKIKVDRGKQINLDTLIIDQENKPVSAAFLYALLEIEQGEPFNEQKISNIPSKIKRLDFLRLADGPSISFAGEKARIKIKLKKRAANSFDGIIGFSTGDDNRLKLTGQVMTHLQNILRRGEKLHFDWHSPGNESQSLNISLGVPYILKTPFGIHSRFELYKQDSSYLNLKFKAGIQYRFTFHHYVELFYRRDFSNVIGTTPPGGAVNYDFTADGFGAAYHFRNLDSPVFPHKGWLLEAEFTGGIKTISKEPGLPDTYYDSLKIESQRLELLILLQRYFKLSPRFILFLSSKNQYLSDEQMGENQLFRLGGINDLKGFDQDALHVSAYSLFNTEVRFLLEKRSFLSLFWNAAAAQQFDKDIIYPMGFGAGLAFETRTGIFSLYYALGKKTNSSIEFRNSKLHFGFISRF